MGRSLAMPTLSIPQEKILYAYHTDYSTLCIHSFTRDFRLEFRAGVGNPQFWGRGGRRVSGMAPFERALEGFYRPSIATFPLPLRVSEILPLLFSSMPLFPYPTSILPKISPCSPGIRWIAFWLQRAKVLG